MNGPATACPHDELLARWMENRVSDEERGALEDHVAGCAACADVTAAVLAPANQTLARRVADAPATMGARPSPGRWAIAAGLVLAAAALGYGALDVGVARMRDGIAHRASVTLGQPVVIGRLAFGVSPTTLTVRVREVRVGGDDGPSADAIDARLSLAALAGRSLEVESLRVFGPVIHLGGTADGGAHVGRAGGTNVVAALLNTKRVGPAPVEIVEGVLLVDVGDTQLRIDHVGGTVKRGDSGVQIALSGSTAGGTVSVNGALTAAPGGLSLSFTGHGLDVGALPLAHDRVSGTADLLARLSGTTDAPQIAGRALIRHGRVRRWNPVREALSQLDGSGAIQAAFPALRETDLVFDELRLVVAKTPGGWWAPRIYATSAAATVGALVRTDAEQRLEGTGTIRMVAPLAAVVASTVPSLATARADDLTLTLPIAVSGSLLAPRVALAAGDGLEPALSADDDSAPPLSAP